MSHILLICAKVFHHVAHALCIMMRSRYRWQYNITPIIITITIMFVCPVRTTVVGLVTCIFLCEIWLYGMSFNIIEFAMWYCSVKQLKLFDGRVRINRPGDIVTRQREKNNNKKKCLLYWIESRNTIKWKWHQNESLIVMSRRWWQI